MTTVGPGAGGGRVAGSIRVLRAVMIALAAVWLVTPDPGGAQEGTLAELSWMEGRWVSESSDQRLEEWWSPPVGNSLVGHFRWIRGDRLWITELLSITEEEGEVRFRLRHFDASMHAWEEREDPFVYRMTDRSAGRVEFTIVEPQAGRPTRFVFQALPGDSLLVRLEGEEGGRPTTQDFRYARGGSE